MTQDSKAVNNPEMDDAIEVLLKSPTNQEQTPHFGLESTGKVNMKERNEAVNQVSSDRKKERERSQIKVNSDGRVEILPEFDKKQIKALKSLLSNTYGGGALRSPKSSRKSKRGICNSLDYEQLEMRPEIVESIELNSSNEDLKSMGLA